MVCRLPVCGQIIESALRVFVCLVGHLCCDVGVMSDWLFLSHPRSLDTEARCKGKSNSNKIHLLF